MKPKQFLRQLGLSQEDLASMVGVSQSMVARILNGERTVSLALALRFETATRGQIRAEDLPLTKANKGAVAALRAAGFSGAAA